MRVTTFLVLGVACALSSVPVAAHDVPVERALSVIVKVEQSRLHLLVRVPLDVLPTVQFPVKANAIDLQTSGPALDKALGTIGETITIAENGRTLPSSDRRVRLSLPSDQSFTGYERAAAHVDAPATSDTVVFPGQGYVDAHVEYPIGSPGSMFAIRSTFAPDLGDHLRLNVRHVPLEGTARQVVILGRMGTVALNPTPYEAARRFFVRGIEHVPGATDYLLLLVGLILPVRSFRALAAIVVAVSLGHSATLVGTAFNLARVGQALAPVADIVMAAAIAYVALENIAGAALGRRWLIAGVSGLVYGFGLSYVLRQELPLAGSHPLVSVVAFNLGIEIGQLVMVAAMAGGLFLLLRAPLGERTGIVMISALVAHTAWHWTVDRGTALWQAGWPEVDGPSLLILARWAAGAFVAITAVRLIAQFRARPAF